MIVYGVAGVHKAGAEDLVGVEAFAYAVGQEVCPGLARWIAALVQQQVCQNRHSNADPIGLPGWTLKKKEE